MKFGVMLPHYRQVAGTDAIARVARAPHQNRKYLAGQSGTFSHQRGWGKPDVVTFYRWSKLDLRELCRSPWVGASRHSLRLDCPHGAT